MSEHLPSLLEQDAQGALFSIPATFREKLEKDGQYTAERLFSQEPDKYRTIVAMLAGKRGIRAIKRLCKVHHDTIHAVAEREHIAIDTLKERIVKDIEAAIQVGAERAVEVMDSIKDEQLLVGLGILIDKYQLLTGGATMRVETADITPKPLPKTFGEWLDGLPSANTGLGGGGNVQRAGGGSGGSGSVGGAAAEGAVPGAVHRLPAPVTFEGVSDVESLAVQRREAQDTTPATGMAAEIEGLSRGEGGVENPGGVVSDHTHSDSGNFAPKGASPSAGTDGQQGAQHSSREP